MLTSKEYENLIIKNDKFVEDTLISLGLVKKYIIENDLIIVGGMAIDLSLKLKGSKLYTDDVLPDYDFYSPSHHTDAYKIAEKLHSAGMKNITVINANHTSTMRVRVNYTVVADVTYIPPSIFKSLPTMIYRDLKIIHPHYQLIDQHRALSLPFENSPWEVITHRWIKDAKRHDLLYSYYPMRDQCTTKYKFTEPIKISALQFANQCVGGFVALLYWQKKAKDMGYKVEHDIGNIDIDENGFSTSLPIDSHGATIYSNDIKKLTNSLSNTLSFKKVRCYNRYLDKLPYKKIINNTYELFDNNGIMRSAYKLDNNIWVANLQSVMVYMLTNWFLLNKMKEIKRGQSFLTGYIIARNIVTWASNSYKKIKKFNAFLPSVIVYGDVDISDSFINSQRLFLEKIKEIPKRQLQPSNIYPDTFVNGKIPNKLFKFQQKKSIIFNFDGSETSEYVDRIHI